MGRLFVFALLGTTAALCGRPASAGSIPIANHSFEAESLLDGQYNYSIQDWTQGGGSPIYGIGTWNPNALYFGGLTEWDGDQIAYLNGGQIAQQLTTGVVLGETYHLSALLGQHYVFAAGGTLELWADGTVADGDVTGGVLIGALVVPTSSLIENRFVLFQTDIVAPTSGLLGGELLSIRFVSNGRESELDNIQLTAATQEVPEPASMTLFGLGSLGLIAARRRRQAAWGKKRGRSSFPS